MTQRGGGVLVRGHRTKCGYPLNHSWTRLLLLERRDFGLFLVAHVVGELLAELLHGVAVGSLNNELGGEDVGQLGTVSAEQARSDERQSAKTNMLANTKGLAAPAYPLRPPVVFFSLSL